MSQETCIHCFGGIGGVSACVSLCACIVQHYSAQDQLIAAGGGGSAPQLEAWFKDVKPASAESKMSIFNIRCHLRILRRLSTAVESLVPPYMKILPCFGLTRMKVCGEDTHHNASHKIA